MSQAPPPSFTALRGLAGAEVLKAGRPAGTLRREDGDTVFTYRPEYLAEDAAPVAVTLPRTGDPVRVVGGAVPPFFAGLLPEGVRLQAVVTATKTSADDHLTLLLALGADAVGDVEVVPENAGSLAVAPAVDEASIASVDLVEVFAAAVGSEPGQLDRVALPGVQAKVSASMISVPVRTTGGDAILKLNPDRGYPRLLHNENFFLDMAASLGFPTPVHRLVTDRSGRSGLLIERFDRTTDRAASYPRLEQEDACQLMGRYPADKYRLRTEDLMRVVGAAVDEGGGSGRLALRRIFALVAFSYLIGNGDLHGKNFSVRRGPNGIREVTPVYDVLCTQPYAGWRDPMALDLYGRAHRLNRTHLLESAERLGIPARAAVRVLDGLIADAPPWIDRVQEIGFDERSTERLRELMSDRLQELRGDR